MVVMGLFMTGAYAQESAPEKNYNKWSLEGGIGVNKPYNSFSPGYRTNDINFFGAELGVRHMLNEFFGLKLNMGYDKFKDGNNSLEFNTAMFALSFEGVANLGRLMKFQTWTQTINLLAHAGAGVSALEYDNPAIITGVNDADFVGNLVGGLTLQVKLSPRVSLYGDYTIKGNYKQDKGFEGLQVNTERNRPHMMKGTIGLSVALGKKSSRADWYVRDDAVIRALDTRLTAVENSLKENSSKDQELAGRVNDMSGRVNEMNKRIDNLDRIVSNLPPAETAANTNELIAKLINDGYVNIYFDFNSSKVKNSSGTLNILRTYLANNPDVNVDLLGYADENGAEEYNLKLSQKRANAVAGMLINAGINPSRINAQGKGEDTRLNKSTPEAYQLARRVAFVIK